MDVALIEDEAAWLVLAGVWNCLVTANPFLRVEWLASWFRHFRAKSDDLFVLAVKDTSGELIGFAPWYRRRERVGGRVIRWLGSGEVASEYQQVVAKPGRDAEVAQKIAEWLLGPGRKQWDRLELSDIDPSDTITPQVVKLLGKHATPHARPGFSRWSVQLPEDWESYLKLLSRWPRHRIRKLTRRAFESGRAVMFTAKTPADLDRGFDILIDLHQRRRISLGEPGCFADNRFTAFHREAARQFLELGRLRLQWIELDGIPVAIDYQLTGGKTIFRYQTGIDPGKENEHPGWLGLMATIRDAIEAGYREMDFLRGDERYKQTWRCEERPSVTLDVVPARAMPKLRFALRQTGLFLRRTAKFVLNRLAPWLWKRGHQTADRSASDIATEETATEVLETRTAENNPVRAGATAASAIPPELSVAKKRRMEKAAAAKLAQQARQAQRKLSRPAGAGQPVPIREKMRFDRLAPEDMLYDMRAEQLPTTAKEAADAALTEVIDRSESSKPGIPIVFPPSEPFQPTCEQN